MALYQQTSRNFGTARRGLLVLSKRRQHTQKLRTVQNESESQTKSLEDIPGPKGQPDIGTLAEYREGPLQKFQIGKMQDAILSRYREYGKIMKETNAGMSVVRLFDPNDIQTVYRHEGRWPAIVPLLQSSRKYREKKGMSPGLGNINGEEWYQMRSVVQKLMMRPHEVSEFLPLVSEVATDFIDRLKRERDQDGNIFNFQNESGRWNLETAGYICYDKRLNFLNQGPDSHAQRMIDANETIFDLGTEIMYSFPNEDITSLEKEHHAAEDYFYGNGQKLVDEAVREIKSLVSRDQLKDGQFRFLSYFLCHTDMNYPDVSMTTLTLFADGLNATAQAFVLALYLLATNPHIQQRAYDEVCLHTNKEEPLTAENLRNLVYLKGCLKETFRMFPLNLDFKRILNEDIVLGGYSIPENTILELNQSVHLRSDQYFDDPETFLPDRWVRGSQYFKNHHPFLLIPFSHGPRMCIGRRIAEQDIYVMLTKILQNFEVTTNMKELGMRYRILQVPDRPVDLVLRDR